MNHHPSFITPPGPPQMGHPGGMPGFMPPGPPHMGQPGGMPIGMQAAMPPVPVYQAVKKPTKPMRRPKADPPSEANQTLYVRNIHEKRNPKAVIRNLTKLFSQHGKVVQVIARKGIPGQAFVVFADMTMAQRALSESKDSVMFGKPLDIQYARAKSFWVAEKEGSIDQVKEERKEKLKSRKTEPLAGKTGSQSRHDEYLFPNAILFLQNLPIQVQKQDLEKLFSAYDGFKEVRTVSGKVDIAFVEYENEQYSAVAKQMLHGYRLDNDHEMKVSFAKR